MPSLRTYCSFEVARLLLGVDVLDVQEVIHHRWPTRVPTARPFVLGLINLRGQIVTVLDLRMRLGLAPPSLPSGRPIDLVVRTSGGAIGLVVDEVRDVFEVDEATLERVPETIPEAIRRLVSGLYATTGRSLLVLDLAKLVSAEGDL